MLKQKHREGKWIEQSFPELLGKEDIVPKHPKIILRNLSNGWFCRLKNTYKHFSRGCYVYVVKGRGLFNAVLTYMNI